jgi:hypothetical protein
MNIPSLNDFVMKYNYDYKKALIHYAHTREQLGITVDLKSDFITWQTRNTKISNEVDDFLALLYGAISSARQKEEETKKTNVEVDDEPTTTTIGV